jgi:hypothetical protein
MESERSNDVAESATDTLRWTLRRINDKRREQLEQEENEENEGKVMW